ncbi:unnamed protein product [Pleuronectes platessa]|uniref:Uncharacterized protein n=1 Tax=Pleuronectes platessa TaxID=8262 RepID=A0A9N7Y7J2_PLEPL|nr:unnamed protein product [Pleuronectes platessa]
MSHRLHPDVTRRSLQPKPPPLPARRPVPRKPPSSGECADVAPGIAQSPPGSASYCLRIALSSRMGDEEGRGGGEKSPPPPHRSGQSQRCSAGSRRCPLSPYRLRCLQGPSEISKEKGV